jgi:hypothetical protein
MIHQAHLRAVIMFRHPALNSVQGHCTALLPRTWSQVSEPYCNSNGVAIICTGRLILVSAKRNALSDSRQCSAAFKSIQHSDAECLRL